MKRSRRLTLSLAAALLAVVLLTVAWWGAAEVPEGQVMAVPGASGEVAEVWRPGWHWRLPWAADPLPLPADPIQVSTEVELTTPEGASIVLDVTGDLAVEDGGVESWVAAAGWRPFVEGVAEVARAALAAEVAGDDPAAIFQEAAAERASRRVREALDAAGLAVEQLFVVATADKNPVAVAAARNRLAALARPTGQKVLVVGWDGADWLMIRPLLEQGRLPNLARLVAGGVSGDLRSALPLLSPLIWTTIATGKPVEEHGIADFLVQDPESGAMVPISSHSRRVHALWTMLPAFGLSSDVVAWWATWPAERTQGTLVTDRVAYQLFDYGEESGEAAGKVHPAEAWPAIAEHLVPAEEVGWEEVRRFVDVSAEELERRWQALPPERRQEDEVNHLRKIIATTRSYHAITLDLLEEQADLTLAYYEGTDTVGHLFARYLPPRLPGVGAEEVARYGGALPAFYEWADELLGELLAAADEDTLVLLISDHGFFTGAARPESDPSDFAAGAPQWHRLHGVVVAEGPGIGHGEIEEASIFDVAPTVLAALGLPVPEDMPGEVLAPLLPPAARRAAPELGGRLASYEVLPRTRPQVQVASADDEDRLRELVALGYISAAALEQGRDGGRGAAGRAAAEGEPAAAGRAPAGGELQGLATEAYNLGRIAQREGRPDEAAEHYRTAIQRMPGFGPAYTSLAQVAAQRGAHGEAFDHLVNGFAHSSTMPQAAITGLVDEAKGANRLADAERTLERLRARYGDQAAYHSAWGLLRETTNGPAEALAHYERALAIDPLDQLAVEQKIALLRRLGREGEARAFLAASFDRAASMSAMNQLAVVALRHRWPADAERLLRRVLESDPGNPGVLANLAAALAQQGKMEEGAKVMRQALARDPGNAGNHFNLGAMLVSQGREAEALEEFEQALEHGLRAPRVYVAAAKMRFRLGDPAGAERDLRRALEIEPGHQEAGQLLQVLRQGG